MKGQSHRRQSRYETVKKVSLVVGPLGVARRTCRTLASEVWHLDMGIYGVADYDINSVEATEDDVEGDLMLFDEKIRGLCLSKCDEITGRMSRLSIEDLGRGATTVSHFGTDRWNNIAMMVRERG